MKVTAFNSGTWKYFINRICSKSINIDFRLTVIFFVAAY